MDVVQYGSRRGPAPKSALALTPDAVRALGKLAGMAVDWAKTRPPAVSRPTELPSLQKRAKTKQRRPRGRKQSGDVVQGSLADNSAVLTINGVFTLATGANSFKGGWTLGVTTIRTDLAAISATIPQMTALGGVYREFSIRRLIVRFEGDLPVNTTSGSVAMSIDDDPGAPQVTTYAGCVNNKAHFICPLIGSSQLSWTPKGNGRDLMKYTSTGGNKPEDDLSFGVLKIVSNNNLAAGTTFGQVYFEIQIGYHSLF